MDEKKRRKEKEKRIERKSIKKETQRKHVTKEREKNKKNMIKSERDGKNKW